ncbi:C39 family peptidase [Actinomadura sp. DC4]|uniref:C39 family peptidase n=1 Tax=Actinomadura sp. DC4 TaxID=3055069 RepID=UPI0025B16251|nr:C39 family peptidase [Actinomadura sp. DC4]MDN3355777.1 C39 family peptidase [Actinomadura sp. DC4]
MTRPLPLALAVVSAGLLVAAPSASATAAPPAAHAVRLAAAKTLPFTWYGQERYYYCGPASTKMALSARMSPPSQTTLGASLGTTTDGTDDISNVVTTLNHYLGTTWYERKPVSDPPTQAQRNLLKQDIVYDVDRGWAIVANVVSGWRPPGYPSGTIYHYVAVVGYSNSGDSAVIADPAGAGAGGSGWANVPKTYTISTYDLGTWIGLKAYAA